MPLTEPEAVAATVRERLATILPEIFTVPVAVALIPFTMQVEVVTPLFPIATALAVLACPIVLPVTVYDPVPNVCMPNQV